MSNPRIWLITGASSGLGREMAELVLKKGEIAVATARKPETLDDLEAAYPASQLLVLKLDVTKLEDIKAAFIQIQQVFGRLDVVFNNAGYTMAGEVEATPEGDARALFDTNFWGAVNVAREAVSFFREVNKPSGGLLLNVSSMLGIYSAPCAGFYTASKHALEGLMEAFAGELDPDWNIKISNLELGYFRTEIMKKLSTVYAHPAYTKPTLPTVAARTILLGDLPGGSAPAEGVQRIFDLSLLPDIPLHFALGKDAVGAIKAHVENLGRDATKFESWSEGLTGLELVA
ncbi:hypothetical protein QCA50_005764 [Cerrena zonata]|uniref:NAD(P)-binding protein n=1 Tax=Cerrena zonata TaxID=2478898 RepID=A0AAW0GHI4_9APHY